MTDPRSDDLQRSRHEAALLLRLDPQNLSPSDALRCDLVATLRLSIDAAQSDALEGRAADLGRLIVATESLVKLLPSEPPKPASSGLDPRQIMLRTYLEMRRRGELAASQMRPQQRLEAARAKVAEIEAELAAGSTAITPPTCDIVPPGERAECDPGMRPGPDDPPKRRPVVIDGKAAPAPPAPATGGLLTDDEPEPWRGFVGSGPGYDRWSDRRT
jgi:hypothetical protein